jgi:hypothetical protein
MSDQVAFYNEGVGHGGFIAQFSVSGFVIITDYSFNNPSKVIEQANQIGAPLKQAAVSTFATWTATAQTPVQAGTNPVSNPVIVQRGETFKDNLNRNCWVAEVDETYRAGEFWMQNIRGRQVLNGN